MPLAGEDVTLDVHGPALSTDEEAHRAELEQVVAELDLDGRVTIGGPVPRAEIPQLFATHDALVNNMRAGAPDKVVYEAAASCLPVLASNPIFDDLLDADQRFTRWDPGALAERVRALAALSPEARGSLGRRLRERVAEGHSVQSWARGILDAEQRFTRWDPGALAERVQALAALSPEARSSLGRGLRQRVAEGHSVQSWARGILEAAGIP